MNAYIYCNSNALAIVDGTKFYLTAHNVAQICDADFIEFFFDHTKDSAFVDLNRLEFSKNVKILEIYDGILIIPTPKFIFSSSPQILFEKQLDFFSERLHLCVLVGSEPKLKFSGYYKSLEISLSEIPQSLEVFPHKELPFIACVLKGKKTSVVTFDVSTFSCVFQKRCDTAQISDSITLTTMHDDLLKHKTVDVWKVGSPFELQSRTVTRQVTQLKDELLVYAFLEELKIGGDYSAFLSAEIKEKASLLPEFLQDYLIVLPPINIHFPNTLALVYENKVKYLTVKCEKTIDDVSLENYPIL